MRRAASVTARAAAVTLEAVQLPPGALAAAWRRRLVCCCCCCCCASDASGGAGGALLAAVRDAGVTCIKLAPVVYALNSTLAIEGKRTLAIVADEGEATLDGAGSVQLVLLSSANSNADLVLANLRLSNGHGEIGGAIYNDGGTVTMHNCVVDSCRAEKDGGAIYTNVGTLAFYSCVFEGNYAVRGIWSSDESSRSKLATPVATAEVQPLAAQPRSTMGV